jgi:putative flavoprotein involved in K+ transport
MTERAARVGTVVIGAGQAGLATSYELSQRGLDHVVLERSRVGEAWRGRWDSLYMILPNWFNGLPGFPYQGHEPDGFQSRDAWVADLARYAAEFALPVRQGVAVIAVRQRRDGRFALQASAGALVAEHVVVATGSYQVPRIPAIATGMADTIHQIHSGGYRNPGALPTGAVLVVGTGNSGSQIAEELYRAGRTVYLSVGYSGFPLRRYRGRDVFWWYYTAKLHQFRGDEGNQRGLGNITGRDGGRALNLHQFARDGVRLLGRIQAIDGAVVTLVPDLAASLVAVDRLTADFRDAVDAYIVANGLDAPADEPSADALLGAVDVRDSPLSLDLHARGITSVIWATGYGWDLAWLQLSVLDAAGAPRNAAGLSPCAGLYFAGMSTAAPPSTSIGGVGAEAAQIAAAIAAR